MSSRMIIRTKRGVEIHSAIQVENIIILYPDGVSKNQSPADFITSNSVYDSLTDGEIKKLAKEILEKSRYIVNEMLKQD
jgi:hypothetical protein